MKTPVLISLLVLSLFTGLRGQSPYRVTPADLSSMVTFLARDEMKGRRNGSPEMKIAAAYIAEYFHQAGLRPAVGDTSWFQEYTIQDRGGQKITEQNVLGILPGSDPALKDEWILISAHFDHVGIGKAVNGDSIYNGADDNATGTVTMMALARLLNQPGFKPRRTLLFAAFSGEEMGMRGSSWLLANPVLPLDKMKLNLNFEMTGEYKTLGKNLYILTGYTFTDFDDILGEYNKTADWQVATKMKSPPFVFLGSDNATFAVRRSEGQMELNIPAFTLVTTDDLNLIHKPTDEPEIMDYDNMAAFTNYCAGLVYWLSGHPLKINWDHKAFRKALQR